MKRNWLEKDVPVYALTPEQRSAWEKLSGQKLIYEAPSDQATQRKRTLREVLSLPR